jgi:hypothetical protein
MIADKWNHLYPGQGTYLFIMFVTEEASGKVRLYLKSNKHTYYWNDEKVKLKWEQHLTSSDKIAIQTFFATIDTLQEAPLPYTDNVSAVRNSLQIWSPSTDSAQGSLIAQLNYVLNNNTAIGIDGVMDLREDVAFAMRFNHTMTSPDERLDANTLIERNNDVYATIREIKKGRALRKKLKK